MKFASSPGEISRVRRNTPSGILTQIDAAIERSVRYYATRPHQEITERIHMLEKESCVERWLQVNASVLGFTSAFLALRKDWRWGFATCGVLSMFLLHGLQGFDPSLLLLRKLGIRTQGEIDREIYALRTLRGDFDEVEQSAKATDIARHEDRVSKILSRVQTPD